MSQSERSDNPQIKEVLKALNHAKRRDILLYLKDLGRDATFSELMDYLEIDTKISSQFSYHLKLLLQAGLIEKRNEKYAITPLGLKATSMLDLVDTSEKTESIVQKISNSYKNLTIFDQIIISFQAFAIVLFLMTLTGIVGDYTKLGVLFLPMILGLIFSIGITIYSYYKLKYIPSILVLSSIIWVIFLSSNHIKIAFIYISSILSLIFIYQATIDFNPQSIEIIFDIILGIACIIACSTTVVWILYKEYFIEG